MGFLVSNIVLSSLFGSCAPYLGFCDFGSQLFLEDAPLVLGPNFGPSVEFWVRLPFFKTQVYVAVALSTTRGIDTKTPFTVGNKIKIPINMEKVPKGKGM